MNPRLLSQNATGLESRPPKPQRVRGRSSTRAFRCRKQEWAPRGARLAWGRHTPHNASTQAQCFLKFKEKIYWRSEKQFLKDWLFQKTVATQGIASIRLKRALDTNTKTVNKPPLFHNLSEGEVPKERHGWLAKGKLFTVSTNEKWKGHRWASGSGYTHWVGPLALGSEHLSWSINTYSKVRRVKGRGPPAFKSSFVN